MSPGRLFDEEGGEYGCPFYKANPFRYIECAEYRCGSTSEVSLHEEEHKRPREESLSNLFACPYFKGDPEVHIKCINYSAASMPEVIRHLDSHLDLTLAELHPQGNEEAQWLEIYGLLWPRPEHPIQSHVNMNGAGHEISPYVNTHGARHDYILAMLSRTERQMLQGWRRLLPPGQDSDPPSLNVAIATLRKSLCSGLGEAPKCQGLNRISHCPRCQRFESLVQPAISQVPSQATSDEESRLKAAQEAIMAIDTMDFFSIG